ncbi:MAG: hypothetical protein BWY74_02041 [Firmicutes bacterium ADurb.Bin419]|nr:MAG: hypothetical protein BWY74_02041 [Firmicutes bacterium ADurb.Bin419]
MNYIKDIEYAIDYVTKDLGEFDPEYDSVNMHQQVYEDTSLGFGGVAGQTITDGNVVTIINTHRDVAYVFVGGRFAYKVDRPRDAFYEDLRNWRLAPRYGCSKYRNIDKNEGR